MLVDVDEGNNEGVCDDVLGMEKIITPVMSVEIVVQFPSGISFG
jgi:hypothetical protein